MASITTRSGKGSALTHVELDNNFTNLNTDKLETSTASSTYLAKAGGTMSGTLTFDASQPTATTSAPNIVQLTNSTNSTSTTTAATPNSVKLAYDLANAALPKTGGSLTGVVDLTVNNSSTAFRIIQSGAGAPLIVSEGLVDRFSVKTSGIIELKPASGGTRVFKSDGTFYTALNTEAVTANRTITLPDGNVTLTSGTMVSTSDTGTVTSAMIADGTIVNADINASAAIAGSKISPDFGSQNVTTTGTSTAASFIPTSSTVPANGIYLPSANTVGISTNSGGRLFIDSSGSVGIGTASPSNTLHVQGTIEARSASQGLAIHNTTEYIGFIGNNSGNLYINAGGTNDVLELQTNGTERARLDAFGRLLFGTSSAVVAGGNITSRLQLHGTDGSSSSWQTTRWSANSSSPYNSLQKSRGASVGTRAIVVDGDDLGVLSFSGDDGTNFVQAAIIKAAVDGTPGTNDMPGRLVFSTTADGQSSPTERMRITSAGNVGIGTTSPIVGLDVRSTVAIRPNATSIWTTAIANGINILTDVNTNNNAVPILALMSDRSDRYSTIDCVRGSNSSRIGLAFQTSHDAAPTEKVRITSDGLVGIGTTNPLAFLHLETPATTAGWQFRLDSVGLNNESGFYRTASDNYEMVLRNGAGGLSYLTNTGGASTSTLEFIVQGSERARIDSSGRLLVGTSTADSTHVASVGKIFIEGVGDAPSSLVQTCWQASNTSQAFHVLAKSGGSAIGMRGIVDADETLGQIAFEGDDGTNFIRAASIRAFVDGTPGTNDMPGRLVFSTTADGASSPTERMRITSAGNVGINQTNPGSTLDVKGTVRLSGSTSGYVGLAPAASAGSTTYTLPSADGTGGQVLSTNGSATLSWSNPGGYTITTTDADKTLANRERCTVTAPGKTITLPASPQNGWEVSITVAGAFSDTIIARNGSNIMSLAQDLTIDKPNVTVTLFYVDATDNSFDGWRIL